MTETEIIYDNLVKYGVEELARCQLGTGRELVLSIEEVERTAWIRLVSSILTIQATCIKSLINMERAIGIEPTTFSLGS